MSCPHLDVSEAGQISEQAFFWGLWPVLSSYEGLQGKVRAAPVGAKADLAQWDVWESQRGPDQEPAGPSVPYFC